MKKMIVVYIVCKNNREAKTIGTALVKEKLAACVNILDGIQSIYRWKGKVEQAKETLLLAKTTSSLFSPLSKKVKELHSYDLPCILRLEISGGEGAYLQWLLQSVSV
jgi:periplasmic divalent cation tolerance protein